MSRFVVATLLTLNLLLIGVQVLGHVPETPPLAALPSKPLQTVTDEGLPPIVLVSETGEPERIARSGIQCYTVGPFETEGSLQRVRDALDGVAVRMHERRTEALMELGFWVSLSPFDSFAEAGDAMRELQRLGLEDVAVVNSEPGVYNVSLGYFLDERNARRRRDDVRQLGFDAVTRLQREAQPRWWLDYAQPTGTRNVVSQLDPEHLAGLNRDIPCAAEMAGL